LLETNANQPTNAVAHQQFTKISPSTQLLEEVMEMVEMAITTTMIQWSTISSSTRLSKIITG